MSIPKALWLSLILTLTGCGEMKENAANAVDSDPGNQFFPKVKGIVQILPTADQPTRVIIDHEEMEGYMFAMIMPFYVQNLSELNGLEPGSEVTFDFHVKNYESWIDNVQLTGKKGKIKTTPADWEEDSDTLSPGDVMPDYDFADENGKPVKLSDYRGMPVAMTFVFARCPVPEYCPKMMRNFNEVREKLETDPEAPEKFQLLTISFDTVNDTPEVLKNWGAAYGHTEEQPWSLLSTPEDAKIREIAGDVGLKFGTIEGSYIHNLRTVILNPDGTVRKIFTDETWNVDSLIEEMKAAEKQE
ncbi:SCO family protein [Verrucomicrobiales bacterium]|nr:SCO family protein [Verrucomicrobiales bacterium]